jgi:eukaryotic-like serine/threonine-protein kinase
MSMSPELLAGRYRLRHAVGQGGMGTVWLAEDELLGREVAIKQVGRLPGESVTDSARAMREVRSSAALNHPNVVSVFDVVDAGAEIWLVMEYVPSRTLAEILRDDGPLSPERAARIGAQVADGLAAAHAVGTIHRDVKPGNVLVGEDDFAKISDFGIARRAGDAALTQTGLMTGTPAYFSPELARGEDPGPASDVWALGATMYAAVEGTPPYPTKRNPIALLQLISSEQPRFPQHAGALTEAITRMMDRNPGSRWQMADVAHALHRLADQPTSSSSHSDTAAFVVPSERPEPEPEPVAPRSGRSTPRSSLVAVIVAAAVLLAAAVTGYLMLDLGGPEDSSATPADGTSSSSEQASPSPSEQASPSPSEQASPSPSKQASPAPSDTPSGPAPGPGADAAKTRFVEGYFDALPSDTTAGWTQLSPGMRQSVGRGSYEQFWGSIDSVRTGDVTPVPGRPAVEVELTYSFSDGRVVTERQRLTLERSGDRYRIVDDTVLSSRTVSG